jgi:GT2 family glycosyltransferase
MQGYCLAKGEILPYVQLKTGSVIADLRNALVKEALKSDSTTHILFVDDDQIFPADTLERLIERDLDIVGANIVRKEPNPRTNSREIGSNGVCWTLPNDTGVKEVDYVGTGLILIKRRVFEAMEYPWYFYDVAKGSGEDVAFCHKAREHGFKTYIDHDLSKEVKHCGSFHWGLEHTDPWRLHVNKQL